MMETISENRCHGGTQYVCRHQSTSTSTPMTFSIFIPDHRIGDKLPVVWYLSGLTCTHANVTEKGEYRAACAALGLIFIAPDTSPRGDAVPDDPESAYDFGLGAGFYVDATVEPFNKHYQMWRYITAELPALVAESFDVDMSRQAIMGHSMGGHGALTIALSYPERFRSVSAFAPIVAPSQVPWGQKALAGYLGDDQSRWRQHDAVSLINAGHKVAAILVDQGTADDFLEDQLKPALLAEACNDAGIDLELRMQPGYDHSYYFISTFMKDHLQWHSERLG